MLLWDTSCIHTSCDAIQMVNHTLSKTWFNVKPSWILFPLSHPHPHVHVNDGNGLLSIDADTGFHQHLCQPDVTLDGRGSCCSGSHW